MAFVVRPCTPKDLKHIMRLVKEIAVLHKVPLEQIRTSVEELQKAGFGERPIFECFVAEVPPEQKSKEGHTLIGYALSIYTYSTWRGRNLYIDNLYVMPEFRGRQIGKKLIVTATEAASRRGCTEYIGHSSAERPENMAIIRQWGWENLSAKEGWNLFRIPNDTLQKIAARDKISQG